MRSMVSGHLSFVIGCFHLLFTSCLFAVAGGTLFVQKISTNGDGVSSATVLYFDEEGHISPFEASDLQVTEGGVSAKVLSVKCPPKQPTQHVSSTLTIDVSGSMKLGGPNIMLAREAALAWVEALTDSSDCAVTTFDHQASVISDHSTNKAELSRLITSIKPYGGTNYEEGMLDPDVGGLRVASEGKRKRVLVFLTDGHGHLNANQVIEYARRNNITVYCVTLGMFMPPVLRDVSEGTGGLWFDRVTTVDQAVMAYRRIFAHASGANGCAVSWESLPTCENVRDVSIRVKDQIFKQSVSVPENLRAGITFSKAALAFGLDTVLTQSVVVTGKARPVLINSISVDRPELFSVSASGLPRTLKRGDTMRLTITSNFWDSTFNVGRISFNAAPCPLPDFYITSGSPTVRPSKSTLKVVHPNGGEKFLTKSLVPLKWEGLPPDLPVRVEVSTNGGFEWTTIAENATQHATTWRAAPKPTDSCLLRVTHVKPAKETPDPILSLNNGKFFRVAFSPDGKRLVTSEYTGNPGSRTIPPAVKLWDANTGALIKSLGNGESISFDAIGKTFIAWDHKGVQSFEVGTGSLKWSKSFTSPPVNCEIAPAGNTVMVATGGRDSSMLLDANTGNKIMSFAPAGRDVTFGAISNDGRQVALCTRDSLITIVNADSPASPIVLRNQGAQTTYKVVFSPDGSLLAMSSGNGVSSLWDIKSKSLRNVIARRQYVNDNTYMTFTRDGRRIAVEMATDMTAIFDVATGTPLVSMHRPSDVGGASGAYFIGNGGLMSLTTLSKVTVLNAYTGVQTAVLPRGEGEPSSPADGSKIAVIDRNLNVQVYSLVEPLLQQDISDKMWRLYLPTGKMRDVLFSDRFVGQSHDTTVQAEIENTSNDTLTIQSVVIDGGNINDFSISSQDEIIIPPKASAPVQFTFHPRAEGNRSAVVAVNSNAGRLSAKLSGFAPPSILDVKTDTIDLGVFPVGVISHITSDSLLRNPGTIPLKIISVTQEAVADSALRLDEETNISLRPKQRAPLHFEFEPDSIGKYVAHIEVLVEGMPDPIRAVAKARAELREPEVSITDPTTFRSILLPSAVIPQAGTFTLGVYDIFGVTAGYSITDNVMAMVGGALPLWTKLIGASEEEATFSTAWSVGAKGGYKIDSMFVVGGGYQFGQSYYDKTASDGLESKITFNAIWLTGGWGTDDSRLNAYVGYAFKNHQTLYEGSFDADAVITGLAYDFRFARQWKVCAETFFMRSMSFVPVTITARYFREHDAFEFGLTITGISASGATPAALPVIPMVSWVSRF